MYLAKHPTKANGYYTRDLLTLLTLTVPWRTSRSPVSARGFHPRILPYRRRTSLELSEAILALYAAGVSTRAISRFLEGIYGTLYSPQSISRLTQVVEEEVQAWRERPLSEEYYAVFLDRRFLSLWWGKRAKEPVYIALGLKPDERREILGFCVFGGRRKRPVPGGGAEGSPASGWAEGADLCDR
ncbi:MAG: transposase [Candidatus Bathyarchaeia archaeon]